MRHRALSFRQKILDVTKAQREQQKEPNRVLDYIRGKIDGPR